MSAISTAFEKPVTTQPSSQFRYLVTLIHQETGDEKQLDVLVHSESFAVLIDEVSRLKKTLNLQGYCYFESLPCDCPF